MGTTVLLVMDIQNGIIDRLEPTKTRPYLTRLAPVIQSARNAGLKIIYITTAFRPGYPELSPRNTITTRVSTSGAFTEGDASTEIHPAVAPVHGRDVSITKRRVSAFHGTDLDIVLRSFDAETLVLTGLTTSGVVLSTLRQAADLDYRVLVLDDLCLDREEEVHELLVTRVFSKQARIMGSREWVDSFKDE
ncbi:hypothetical protein MAP00_004304 [Monascus purpureus]|nr:hypothetical protein MAP00_004304 [Monascus purpureus]